MGLLKGINPLLSADLLHILRDMGHGDRIVICDCNFPASSTATQTTTSKKVIHLSVPLPEALDAICSLLPLDRFIECPAYHMSPQNNVEMPIEGQEVIDEARNVIAKHSSYLIGAGFVQVLPMERFEFYEYAKTCFAVVQTMERRPYGNIVLTKGVIGPDGQELTP